MVMQKSVMKYMTRMGQKTGMLKKSKKVQTKAMAVAFVAEYQNLNSEAKKRTVVAKSSKLNGYRRLIRRSQYEQNNNDPTLILLFKNR